MSNSTLYKYLEREVESIAKKDGCDKDIKKHNIIVIISLIFLFLFLILIIFLLGASFFDILKSIFKTQDLDFFKGLKNFTSKFLKINLYKLLRFILIVYVSLFIATIFILWSKGWFKKKLFFLDEDKMVNKIILKIKSHQKIENKINTVFKNADDKNDVKHILINEAKINNDKKSPQIIVTSLYYFITSLIAIILTVINNNFLKILLLLIIIIFIVCCILFHIFYISKLNFYKKVLETYIKDYIMNC